MKAGYLLTGSGVCPSGSQRQLRERDGVQDSGPDMLIPLLGKVNDGAERLVQHENIREKLSDERCWAVR